MKKDRPKLSHARRDAWRIPPPLTLGEHFERILPGVSKQPGPPVWPPDAFALAASAVQRGDAYTLVVDRWPPKGKLPEWLQLIEDVGERWRKAATSTRPRLPKELREWWQTISSARDRPLGSLRESRQVCEALLQLIAAADEASAGVGMFLDDPTDSFEEKALILIAGQNDFRSVCADVHPSRAIVLPKVHTPQTGITLRSLTHHLALCLPGEVCPMWRYQPTNEQWGKTVNLLLLPWPETVRPGHFRASKRKLGMPDKFGFFGCDVRGKTELPIGRVLRVVREARKLVGRVDGIVFPELALREMEHFDIAKRTGAFVVGGLGRVGRSGAMNCAVVAMPLFEESIIVDWEQSKHHRWRLDASQIMQYGLAAQLRTDRLWWEDIEVGPRQLTFWSPRSWCTVCALICEDLARQDPVADVLRSVGPNLVIALLLDGPQLKSRWSARYATVLAEDPGSAVLTLTSVGMSMFSRVPGKEPSRVVALWKDVKSSQAREITLSPGADGIILVLEGHSEEEWSADGRSDHGVTTYLQLASLHEVRSRVAGPG